MFTTARFAALALLFCACDVASPAVGTAEQAIVTCPPPRPSAPTCYRVVCGTDGWEPSPLPTGSACTGGGTCNDSQQCVRGISVPSIDNLSMFTPTQLQFDLACSTGQPTPTTVLKVSLDNSPVLTTLPDTCAYYGSGHRYDDYNVRPGQQRCYAISASNSTVSATGTTRCFTTPLDYTSPTAPDGQITRTPGGGAVLTLYDRSVNETLLRVWSRRANVGEPWQLLCTMERYNANHQTGFPHSGVGEQYQCGLSGLVLGTSYEARFEAFHDRVDLSSFTVLPAFQPLPPIPDPPKLEGENATDTTYTFRWAPVTYATAYRIYQGTSASQLTYLSSTSNTRFTATGLPRDTYLCFDVTAVNDSGESTHSWPVCGVTRLVAPEELQVEVLLYPKADPITGQVVYRNNFRAEGRLDSIELRPEDNVPALAGLIATWGTVNDADPTFNGDHCKLTETGATFTDSTGVLQGAKLGALYDGDQHPSLRTSPNLKRYIGGCPIFATPQSAPPASLTAIVHYTGY